MLHVTESELKNRFSLDNPWWENGRVDPYFAGLERRAYFPAFMRLVAEQEVRRAIVLMGPRRVGKTVMLQQAIHGLLAGGYSPQSILYLSLDTPIYARIALEKLLRLFFENQGHDETTRCTVVFDEVQYLRDWEVHLKSLVDTFRRAKFVASGSAAAALRLKSRESGAGRFSDFLLPPLTFAEFLRFRKIEDRLIRETPNPAGWAPYYATPDIGGLNTAFADYVNFGGYPETALSEEVRAKSPRYIRDDIIDKVLLRDLPSLYGISDIQELNGLFTTLAYNTASEISYEGLSKTSGVAKNTLRRYLEYLEAAFLIRRIRRVDRSARRFQRDVAFKVYLTNASMRAALFESTGQDDEAMGRLAETAIFDQWMHTIVSQPNLHYARWPGGEVDIVQIARDATTVLGAAEIKWSDRHYDRPSDLRGLLTFAREHDLSGKCVATTRTAMGTRTFDDVKILFEPCALYCFRVGHHAVVANELLA